MAKPVPRLSPAEIQRVIATAWDDAPPYNRVLLEHGLLPGQLVQLLRRALTPQAYKLWSSRGRAGVAAPRPGARRAPPAARR